MMLTILMILSDANDIDDNVRSLEEVPSCRLGPAVYKYMCFFLHYHDA